MASPDRLEFWPRSLPAWPWLSVPSRIALLFLLGFLSLGLIGKKASDAVPPRPTREIRGAWIATVANLDWPSKPGLSSAEQKAELIALCDKAVELHLNLLIFQVRPACDAFYRSELDPWSEFLTGQMGKAPEPFYDPLAFAVEEAHRRGLELHAWFNPYRARLLASKSPAAANHVSLTR